MTYESMLRTALEQSALESGCAPEDFLRDQHRVMCSAAPQGARAYLTPPAFCDLTSYGPCVIVSADARFLDAARAYVEGRPAFRCFETPYVYELSQAASEYGMIICHMAEFFLPVPERVPELHCPYDMRVLTPEGFADCYTPQWSNALSESRRTLDKLAVGAYDGDRLVGLAGCSADCDDMWQVGVDVLPAERGRGVASALTARLTREIMARGKTPFYSAAWANLASCRNAARCGYKPVWVQMSLSTKEDAAQYLRRRGRHVDD